MAQTDPSKLFDKLLYINENDTLPYRLLKPESSGTQKLPLVIFLHGAGERGIDNEAQIKHIAAVFGNRDNRKNYPCYVLAPQCPENLWWAAHDRNGNKQAIRANPTRPMELVIKLIAEMEKFSAVDPTRIYVTGLSMGGYGTWDLLARFPNRFAAAVPVCGGGVPETAAAFSHVPIWAFHGALDRVVPPRQSRMMVTALQDAGGSPGYTEYPDTGHDSWTLAYADPYLLPWMFGKQLGKKSTGK